MNFKPTMNRFRYPRNVPLVTPKAAISKDMVKHGFRFVGLVILYSFMQAAGWTIDHLVDCFRHGWLRIKLAKCLEKCRQTPFVD